MNKTVYDQTDPIEAFLAFATGRNNLEDYYRERVTRRIMDKEFPDVSGRQVLDVGAGDGRWSHYWNERGAQVAAIEQHLPLMKAAQFANPAVKFIHGHAESYDYPDYYDIIFAKEIIEHIPDDKLFLGTMAGNLKKGGKLILTTQNAHSLNYLADGGYNFLGGNIFRGYDPQHLRFYTYEKLATKLEEAGMRIIKVWGHYHFPYRFLGNLFFKRLIESKIFHLVDILKLNTVWPFARTGWIIGVIAEK